MRQGGVAARGGDGRVFARFDEPGGELPERPIVFGGRRPERARRADSGAQEHVVACATVLAHREVCGDDDRIEGPSRPYIVREWRAFGAVWVVECEIEPTNVEKAARRSRSVRTIARNHDADRWRVG
jgi:hypothetical protein